MIASFMSIETCEGDLRLKREPFELERADADGVEERSGLSRPGPVVQLIEREDGALRHPRREPLQRDLARLVEIEIEVEERHDQMRVPVDVIGNRFQRIA